ncbi:MAG: TonB-dependent receptor [Hydrogenophilaceae bacterium]|nr:TonB-dependent receptor [Hydrogenophilaceae bacterium]
MNHSLWGVGSVSDALDPPHKSDNDNRFIQLAWRRQHSPDETYSLQYTRSNKDYENAWVIPGAASGLPWDVPVDLNYTVQREQLEFQANLVLDAHSRAAYGAEMRRDEIQSHTFFAPGGSLSEEMYRLFGTWEWRPHAAWLANLGGMLEHHYLAGSTFSPRFSLHYLPSGRHAFRLGLSRGYRSETFFEQVPNYGVSYAGVLIDQIKIPSPNLKPEMIDSRELGYVGSYPELRLNLNLRLFNDHLQRLIEAVKQPFPAELSAGKRASQDQNIVDIDMWGAEYQVQWQPEAASRIVFNQAWIWQKARDHLIPGSNDENEMETSAPRLSYSLLAMRDFGQGVSASIGYHKVGQMSWLGEGDPIPAYRRFDLRLAKAWRTGQGRYELALTLQNLFRDQQDFEEEIDHQISANRAFVSLRFWD